jgi:hypothetical protein
MDKSSKPAQELSTSTRTHRFPTSFNLYRPSLGHLHTYTLGEHENTPLYTIRTHPIVSKQPDIVLHTGPGENSPVLATYSIKSFSFDRSVELDPAGSGTQPLSQHVRRNFRTYGFELELAGPEGPRWEKFEWRRSRGPDIPRVGAQLWGHKLVWLAGAGAEEEVVVAMCSRPGSAYTGSKVLKFEFVDSDAWGVLGDRGATMAVITALGQWTEDVRRRLFYIYPFVCVV